MSAEQQWQANTPTIIGGYTISQRLGSGSFSTVFKALPLSPDADGIRRTVAIKVIDMRIANSSKLNSDCVVSEIKILKSLKHRNIVHLYDFQWDRNNIYLIMEYCGGGDLATFIKHHGAIPESVTRRFLRQLASAIQYMRAMNITHMDLKPQNILLTNHSRPSAKVSDFGLSQYIQSGERASSFRGSPLYMAPEIIARRPYDSRVDLWSCGVILYECLYGFPPFVAQTYDQLIEQILHSTMTFPTNVQLSVQCFDLLRVLLVRNPEKRITFDKFFIHPFVALNQGISSSEIKGANSLVEKSLEAEAQNDLVEATKCLMKAIQINISSLELYDEGPEKVLFREKIKNDLERAERMKERMRPIVKEIVPVSPDEMPEWNDVPQVKAAQLIAKAAQTAERLECWDEALAKYTLAIEGVLKVLANENRKTQRASALQSKTADWLTSAERIKKYLEVMSEDGLGTLTSNSDDNDSFEKQLHVLNANTKQCTLI